MKRLYFMRHGLSEMNVQGIVAGGVTETPLTDEGRVQAKKAGQAAHDLKIDLIVSSPQSRALETAQIVAREIGYPEHEIKVNSLLIERHFGVMEGRPFNGDPSTLSEAEGYEHDKKLVARAQKALDWINGLEADHILVVSHGSFGRAMRSLLKTDYPMSHPERLHNAEIMGWVEEEA